MTAATIASIGKLSDAPTITAVTHRGLEYLEDLLDDRRSEFMKDL